MKSVAIVITSLLLALMPITATASAPTITPQVFQITNDPSQQSTPLVDGNLVAYTNFGGSQSLDVWGYDLTTKTNFPIIVRPDIQFLTGLYKNLVIYSDYNTPAQTATVRMFDRTTGTDTLITPEPGTYDLGVTNGKYIAYIKGGACGTLFTYEIATGTTSQIATPACTPKISGHNLIWSGVGSQGQGIYGLNLSSNKTFTVVADSGLDAPNVYKDTVVWSTNSGHQILSKDLSSDKVTTLIDPGYYVNNPAISADFVVWGNSHAPGTAGVEGIDRKTNQIIEIFPQGPHQNTNLSPAMSGNVAVWQAWRTGNGDIYGAVLSK